MPLALEVDHGIDHVLQDAWPGELAFLGDMAHEKYGAASGFGMHHQRQGGFAQLRHRAGRGVHVGLVHRLDGVDDQHLGPGFGAALEDLVEVGLRSHEQVGAGAFEPCGSQLELAEGFFTRDVEGLHAARGEQRGGLQKQGGLADTRITTDEDQRTFDHAAAEHPVELGDARAHPVFILRGHVLEGHDRTSCPQPPEPGPGRPDAQSARTKATGADGGLRGRILELDQGVPRIARRALASPFGKGIPALFTRKNWVF